MQIASSAIELIDVQRVEIAQHEAQAKAFDSTLIARSLRQRLTEVEVKEWHDRYDNQAGLIAIERRKNRKWVMISVGVLAAWIGREVMID